MRSIDWSSVTSSDHIDQADELNEIADNLEGMAGLMAALAETLPDNDERAKGLASLVSMTRDNAGRVRRCASKAVEDTRRAS